MKEFLDERGLRPALRRAWSPDLFPVYTVKEGER